MTDSIVQTTAGAVSGYQAGGLHVFKGVPYGAPVGGAGRFRPAKPAPTWTGVREAKTPGAPCPQAFGEHPRPTPTEANKKAFQVFGVGAERDPPQSEDCLVVNIWTPGVGDHRRRPVLFRIHGGGFGGGSGTSIGWYDGANLARRGDAVVVTVNHRLGVLGYLYLDQLGGEAYAGSGNVGITDLVLALEWVRDNIEAFGGDPARVMIFGESGGGAKTTTLLATPAARGLFHRAIVQSGPFIRATEPAVATAAAEQVLKELDIRASNLAALADRPLQQILDAHNIVLARGQAGLGLSPVLDGKVLPAHPVDAVAAGASADVPVIIGTTSHEVSMFMALEPQGLPDLDEAGMRARLEPVLGDRFSDVVGAFRSSHPDASMTELTVRILSGVNMRTPSIALADAKVAGGSAPVYMYMLTWRSPIMSGALGAAHGMCVPLSMDNCDTALWSDFEAARPLAARMSQAWINFGAAGDPNAADLPAWAPYAAPARSTMMFDDPCHLAQDPFPEERVALEGIRGPLG